MQRCSTPPPPSFPGHAAPMGASLFARAGRAAFARSAGLFAVSLLVAGCGRPPEMPVDPGPPAPEVEYVTRQEILTPLPLRVRLPARYRAEYVLVFFHTWGSRDWGVLPLARAGQTWAGEVSCREVSTVTGDTKYFFLALDARGNRVASSGSEEWPHVATIVGELPDGPQTIAGEEAPLRCHDPADCPPDFPGCPAYAFRRPACQSDLECGEGGHCSWDHYCDELPVATRSLVSQEQPETPSDDDEDESLDAAVRAATKRYQTAAAEGRRPQ